MAKFMLWCLYVVVLNEFYITISKYHSSWTLQTSN